MEAVVCCANVNGKLNLHGPHFALLTCRSPGLLVFCQTQVAAFRWAFAVRKTCDMERTWRKNVNLIELLVHVADVKTGTRTVRQLLS